MMVTLEDWGPATEMFGVPAHARARELIDDTGYLWAPDLGALEQDRGHCAASAFREWRREHQPAALGTWLRETAASWDLPTVYGEDLLLDEKIQSQIEADPHFDCEFHQGVWVLDVTIIASAFAQLVVEGRIDADAKPIVRLAIRRQQHPLVLREIYRNDRVVAERSGILEGLASVLERA